MGKATKGSRANSTAPEGESSLSQGMRESNLIPLVEAEIIPRLMMAHRAERARSEEGTTHYTLQPDEVVQFVEAILHKPPPEASEQIERLRAHGLALESVYLYLLAPAARYLGELWEADLCNFSQVTLGLWRIQQIMYELSPAFLARSNAAKTAGKQHRILLATLPQSQHTFGVSMLSEFFRREGWTVLAIPSPLNDEVAQSLANSWFDVFALSASADREIEGLHDMICRARKHSCNPDLSVIVGGALFLRQPALVKVVGADAMSDDAPGALAMATQLVHRQGAVRFNQ